MGAASEQKRDEERENNVRKFVGYELLLLDHSCFPSKPPLMSHAERHDRKEGSACAYRTSGERGVNGRALVHQDNYDLGRTTPSSVLRDHDPAPSDS